MYIYIVTSRHELEHGSECQISLFLVPNVG